MIDKKFKLLLVFAHPDDETSACGGIIIKYSKLGHSVDVCTTTNGDKGDLGTGDLKIHRKELGKFRETEQKKVLEYLGANAPFQLGHGDQELQKMSPGVLSEQIYNVYKQVTPDIVITFGPKGFSDHTDHIETHKAATSAFNLYKKENNHSKLFYLAANRDFVKKFNMILSEIEKSPTHNVDITFELKEKISALKMYKSQKDAQDLSEMFLALYKEFGAIESFVQIYPKISVAKNKKIRTSTSILN